MEWFSALTAFFESTDPLNLGSPWVSWKDSVKPFYTKHTVVIAFIAALYLPVVSLGQMPPHGILSAENAAEALLEAANARAMAGGGAGGGAARRGAEGVENARQLLRKLAQRGVVRQELGGAEAQAQA